MKNTVLAQKRKTSQRIRTKTEKKLQATKNTVRKVQEYQEEEPDNKHEQVPRGGRQAAQRIPDIDNDNDTLIEDGSNMC